MIKTINGYTKASMIEAIKTRMLGHRSGKEMPSRQFICKYKAPDGNRCAVGVFIPSGHEFENSEYDVMALHFKYPEIINYMPLEIEYMKSMQEIHDDFTYGDPRPRLIKWIEDNVID